MAKSFLNWLTSRFAQQAAGAQRRGKNRHRRKPVSLLEIPV
jgi:hypothetical protein